MAVKPIPRLNALGFVLAALLMLLAGVLVTGKTKRELGTQTQIG